MVVKAAIALAAVRTKLAFAAGSCASTNGTVLCRAIPVSPVTPFRVTTIVLVVGNWIQIKVVPAGTVMVFAPEARATEVTEPIGVARVAVAGCHV